ncbi:MAG: hypothetical protein GKC09_09910 [Methanosarcinales archaeon]|jgi:hypothetical protein|nr:hypothetical protein [Methanosarcinales archaeon]
MNGKKLVYQVESPKTQSTGAVKALLAFKKVASNPLPQEVSLDGGRLVLVLSNKKDAFYTVTARACSCPAATYHHGPCKHQRKHFSQPKKSREELEAEGEAILEAHHNTVKRLARPPDIRDSLPGWPEGAHGPVEAI